MKPLCFTFCDRYYFCLTLPGTVTKEFAQFGRYAKTHKSCCHLAKRVLIRRESTLFTFFIIYTAPEIAMYCRNRICQIWANGPYVQTLTEIS